MISNWLLQYSYFTIALTALLVNIPFGFIREKCPRFSFKWLFWIHASIPILIYMRISLHISSWFAPVSIFYAVLGQILGSQLKRKQMTNKEADQLNQIPDLNFKSKTPVESSRVLVALLNMGGPKKNSDVKDFQHHLFSDPLLIRFPLSFLFQKLFASILIKLRLKTVEETYRKMGGGSPIYDSTTRQAKALREELDKRSISSEITFSFNYSPPFPTQTVEKAKALKKEYLLPLSLYPHYSKATTGSNIHYLKKAAQEDYPELKFLHQPTYHLHEGYIGAFVDRIYEALKPGESLDDFYIVFTAHGLPLYFLNEGDPYPFLISQTVAQILAKLNREENWVIAYQSAVGPLQWLKPATDEMIKVLAREGEKKLLMVPVAFVGDHIETTIEIDQEYRELAEHAGIEDYRMSKAIETHPGFIDALADTVERALAQSMLPVPQFKNVEVAISK